MYCGIVIIVKGAQAHPYSRTTLLQSPSEPHEVSWLKKCHSFRGCLLHFSMYIAGATGSVLTEEVSFIWSGGIARGFHVGSFAPNPHTSAPP